MFAIKMKFKGQLEMDLRRNIPRSIMSINVKSAESTDISRKRRKPFLNAPAHSDGPSVYDPDTFLPVPTHTGGFRSAQHRDSVFKMVGFSPGYMAMPSASFWLLVLGILRKTVSTPSN